MKPKTILGMVDLLLLTVGGLLGATTQMERVTAIPVEVLRVGRGGAVVQQGDLLIVTLSKDGVTLNGQRLPLKEVVRQATGKDLVLRSERDLPTGETMEVLAELFQADASVSLEVEERD